MHAARHDAADAGNQLRLGSVSDDASRRAHDVDHVSFFRTRTDRIPVSVKGSDRNRNARAQAQSLSPLRSQLAGEFVGGCVFTIQFRPNPGQ